MSIHALIMWGVVLCVGVPSAWRNPTAAALVIAKIAGWAWDRVTGDNLPVTFYLFPDIFCTAIIMAKAEYCNHRPYQGSWHQLKCLLLERSPADRAVMLAFAACWVFYVMPIHDYYRWWVLWGLTILQFLFASSESLEMFWRHRAIRKSVSSIIDRHLVVTPVHRRAAERALLAFANGGGGDG